MVVFLRSYLVGGDTRLQRYLRALGERGVPFHVLSWDRELAEPDTARVTHYRRAAPLGAGIRNLWNLLCWNLWCLAQLVKRRRDAQVVHAIDLDTGLAAALFCLMWRRRFIYDAFDLYSASRAMRPAAARRVDALERWVMRRADRVLLPDECRRRQHGVEKLDRGQVIENVPAAVQLPPRRPLPQQAPHPLVLAYVGTLAASHRGIEDLLEWTAAHPSGVRLEIAGGGVLRERCERMAAAHPNIRFHGPVAPERGLAIMADAQVIVGLYYRSSPNHLHAAPNKYFEHLLLARPLLTTAGTPPGDKVAAARTGWAIAEGRAALDAWWTAFRWDDARAFGERAGERWDAGYAEHFQRVLVDGYAGDVARWLHEPVGAAHA